MAVQVVPFSACIGTACVMTSAPVWATGGAVLLIGFGLYRWLAGDDVEQKRRLELEEAQRKVHALTELSLRVRERIRLAQDKERDQFLKELRQFFAA